MDTSPRTRHEDRKSPPLDPKQQSTPPTSSFRLLILEPQPISPPKSTPDPTLQPSSCLSNPPRSLLPPLLTALTGTAPLDEASGGSISGYTSHPPVRIRNKYIDVQVPLWCDQIPPPREATRPTEAGHVDPKAAAENDDEPSEGRDNTTSSNDAEPATTETWLAQMQSPLAAEVRDVIGAIILVLPAPLPANLSPYLQTLDRSILSPTHSKLLSTAHSLRETISSSRPETLDPDIPSILLLQASSPSTSTAEKSTSTTHDPSSPSEPTADDHVVESVESHLFDTLSLFGWDVVLWSPPPPPIHPSTQQPPPYSPPSPLPAASLKSPKRNIHGELTGLPRLLEVLANVDWEASPAVATQGDQFYPISDGQIDPDDVGGEGARPLLRVEDEDDNETDEAQEEQVEQLAALMGRALAIREMGGSRAERERALRGLVRDL